MGIVAHPGPVTALAVSADGSFLFSAGGADLSVNMWRIEPSFDAPRRGDATSTTPFRGSDSLGGGQSADDVAKQPQPSPSMLPFFSLLDGGVGGDLHNDIIDYFYYCQLRHIGEDSMDPRDLNGATMHLSRSRSRLIMSMHPS
jgi:WD40 repeat protein